MADQFADILEANRVYAQGFTHGELAAPAAKGLAVLTCIDSRIEPLAMLGLRPGDAKILRNAGARVTDDALRSLVLAANLLDVMRVMVVAHTDCAMAGTSDEALRKDFARRYSPADVESVDFHTMPDQHAALAADVDRVRECRLLPTGVSVAGFEYDVRTGLLRQVVG